MGRFRFLNMIPSSWFHSSIVGHKVKNKLTKTHHATSSSSSSSTQPATFQRKSYYFTRGLAEPDPTQPDLTIVSRESSPPKTHQPAMRRKSTKIKRPGTPKRPISRKLVSPKVNPATQCSCGITLDSVSVESNSSDTEVKSAEQSFSCSCNTNSSYDVVYKKVDLPPIITRPAKQDKLGSGKWVINEGNRSLSVRVMNKGIIGISPTNTLSPVRKMNGNYYSPRLGNKVRVNGLTSGRRRNGNRRSLSESMAVVKTSVDPSRDFKESMVEMITQYNMKSTKDLEDLLACYLALNSNEYHDLIIKVFKQIWFESSDIRL